MIYVDKTAHNNKPMLCAHRHRVNHAAGRLQRQGYVMHSTASFRTIPEVPISPYSLMSTTIAGTVRRQKLVWLMGDCFFILQHSMF